MTFLEPPALSDKTFFLLKTTLIQYLFLHYLWLPHSLSLSLPTYVFIIFPKQDLVFPPYIRKRKNKHYFIFHSSTAHLIWWFITMFKLMHPNSDTQFYIFLQWITLKYLRMKLNCFDQRLLGISNLYQPGHALACWQSWEQQRHRDYHKQKTPCHFISGLEISCTRMRIYFLCCFEWQLRFGKSWRYWISLLWRGSGSSKARTVSNSYFFPHTALRSYIC